MDSLELIRAFREVASHGSFSRAADRLQISRGTASKYVAELEARFGIRLLNRSTRSVSLTDAGALLLERSKPVLEMLAATEAELKGHASRPSGRLRIMALPGMGHGDLPRLLGQFMGYYPEVSISLHLTGAIPVRPGGCRRQACGRLFESPWHQAESAIRTGRHRTDFRVGV